ncbi:MAG TPA: ankyrin repeat domain-containing protein [Actinomycetota bacterium]
MTDGPRDGLEDVLAAIEAGDADALSELIASDPSLAETVDEAGVSVLLQAKYRGENELVEILRAAKPSLDLFEAAALGEDARVAELLDAEPYRVSGLAADGFSPLHLAVFFAHPSTAQLLLDRDADVNAEADNSSHVQPLHSAAAGRSAECVRVLLDAGADVDARQHGGYTPLMEAALQGSEEMARALLGAGADPTLTDDDGRNSIEFARAEGHTDVAELLDAAAGP